MVLSNKEWLDKMDEIISAIQNGGGDIQVIEDMLSNMWISSATYNVGDYVLYNSNIWKCLVQNSNIAPSEGNTWTRVNITSEISALNSNLDNVNTEIQSLSSNWVNNDCENNKWIFDLTNKTVFRQGILIICTNQNGGVYVGKAYINGTNTVNYIGISDDNLVSVSYSNSILTVTLNYDSAWATCTIIGL